MKDDFQNKNIDNLILDYLQKSLSKEDEAYLLDWINMSAENKKYFDDMVNVWVVSAIADDTYTFDTDKAFDKFLNNIGKQTLKKKVKSKSYTLYYRIAGIAAAIFAIAYISFFMGGNMVEKQFMDIVVEAPLGSKSKMYLPDGTLVWLNAGSKITYSQGFGVKDRNVELTGEAYFEVARNENLPFDVNTEDLKLEVLGTKFNFRNYPDDPEAVIELLEGKVQVENLMKEMPVEYLAVNEKIVLDKRSGEMDKISAKTEQAKDWISDILFFDEKPLSEIANELSRIYNVKIKIESSDLMDRCFYGYFDTKKQSVDDILNSLVATGGFSYTNGENNIIVINKEINNK